MNNSVALYELASEFSCISCGAKFLPEGEHELCEACSGTFDRWMVQTGRTVCSEAAVNSWLARKLLLDAKRMERFGVLGRCEAVTCGPRGFLDTYINKQCRLNAVAMRGDRRVCGLHAKTGDILYAGTEASDPYSDLQNILTRLATVDRRLLECLKLAVAGAR